jgi:glutamine synthetase
MQGMLSFPGKEETLKFISDNSIRILNLCHIPEDGRLRTLSFSAASKDRVAEILDYGERADGSSLFRSIAPGKSDIYLKPETQRAFVNPFAVLPTLNIMCGYLDDNGEPLEIAPSNVLRKAEEGLRSSKGMVLKALAELEFYIMAPRQAQPLFQADLDSNYHASSPFTQYEEVRNETLAALDMIGIQTKYGHGEVGCIVGKNDMLMEQHEIELIPQTLSQMAEAIPLAKWTIRNVCLRHGVSVSFVPKMDLAHAGTGMHVHLCAARKGKNVIPDQERNLSKEALAMIGGILKLAPSLSAFGNSTPISYLRFIARKESPMHICWSTSNRLALIRIPLWWNFMKTSNTESCKETFEYRAPDAFANTHMLLAGLAIAAEYGTSNSNETVKIAEDLHVDGTGDNSRKLQNLPRSCSESAANLRRQRHFYEANGIFPRKLVDSILSRLEAYGDKNLWKTLSSKPEMFETLVTQYMHYG